MADEPRGFNPGYVNPAEPGTDPIPVGDQAPTPTHGVPPESLPPPIKGGVGVTVSYDGRSYVIDVDTSDLYATPKPGTVTWDTLDQEVEDMIRDFSWNSLTDVPATFPPSPHHHPWSDIDDVPLEFPPAAHTHTKNQITDFPTSWDWSAIANKPTAFPPTAHTHTVSQISDFPSTWAWTDLSGVPSAFPPSSHTHPISQVTDLQAELDTKLEDAPVDGFTYGRKNGAWEKAAGAAQIADAAPATGDVGTFWWSSLTGQLSIRYMDDGGPLWVGLNGSITTAVLISDTAPTSSYHGLLWWQSSTGELSIRYNDGDSEQWVSAFGGAAQPFRGCKLTVSGGQLIPTAVTTIINWNAEAFDTDGFHDNVTNNSRITIPAGVSFVELTAQSEWQGSATGAKVLSIYKNGVLVAQSLTTPGHAGSNTANCSTGPLPVVPGDYFTVGVYQETGANLTFSWTGYAWFSMKVLG